MSANQHRRKTTYDAGVYEDYRGGKGFIAWAEYETTNENFGIYRRGRTEREALASLYEALCAKWRPMPVASKDAKKLWRLLEAIDKEIARL